MSQIDRSGLRSYTTQLVWRDAWQPGETYETYNLTYFDGSTYFCEVNHTAGASFLADFGGGFWSFFAREGDPGASGSGTGDLLASNNLSDVSSAASARGNLSAAKSGANSDITSLSGLTTPLSQAQGGSGANTIPVFSAYQSSAQTLAAAAYTKITVDTEEYDTNNNFATSRFTCTVPGYYLFTAGLAVGATRTEILPVLYKNGSAYRNFGDDNTESASVSGSMLIKLDATDYVEFYAYFALGQVTTAGSRYTYFQGHLVKAT